MQTFTPKEYEYLERLKKRNHELLAEDRRNPEQEQSGNLWDPLENPMSLEERKLRKSIKMKMTLFAEELAYAFHCNMPPEKRLWTSGVRQLDTMIWFFKGIWWLKDKEESGDIEEVVRTKYIDYDSVYMFGSAGELIKKMAVELRETARTKNPELFDRIAHEIEQETTEVLARFGR